jgi:hypothetical protein
MMQIKRKQIQEVVKAVKGTFKSKYDRYRLCVVFDPDAKRMLIYDGGHGENSFNVVFCVDLSYTDIPELFGIRFNALENVAGKDGYVTVVKGEKPSLLTEDDAAEEDADKRESDERITLEWIFKCTDAGVHRSFLCDVLDVKDCVTLSEYPVQWVQSDTFLLEYNRCALYVYKDNAMLAVSHVAISEDSLVATDKCCLRACRNVTLPALLPPNKGGMFLLPDICVPKSGVCELGATKSFFAIKLPEYTVLCSCVEGRFPAGWREIIPSKVDNDIEFTLTETAVAKYMEVSPFFPKMERGYGMDSVFLLSYNGMVAFESTHTKNANVRLITDVVCEQAFKVRVSMKYLLTVLKDGLRSIRFNVDGTNHIDSPLVFSCGDRLVLVMCLSFDDIVTAPVESEVSIAAAKKALTNDVVDETSACL